MHQSPGLLQGCSRHSFLLVREAVIFYILGYSMGKPRRDDRA
ncbi:hypothetical protein D088_470028 [Salmonella enterica subsp. houtenae serovar 16:z4,z32:-- str. RKS3027]|nr:hypothetical protein D088_470028 [Salmonella enterica subsp. houtenae serovar 16:z4,z32:-- str. RKS3027]